MYKFCFFFLLLLCSGTIERFAENDERGEVDKPTVMKMCVFNEAPRRPKNIITVPPPPPPPFLHIVLFLEFDRRCYSRQIYKCKKQIFFFTKILVKPGETICFGRACPPLMTVYLLSVRTRDESATTAEDGRNRYKSVLTKRTRLKKKKKPSFLIA